MEILSETDQAQQGSGFVPNVFINIDGYVERKIEIMKIYKSEIDMAPFLEMRMQSRDWLHTEGNWLL